MPRKAAPKMPPSPEMMITLLEHAYGLPADIIQLLGKAYMKCTTKAAQKEVFRMTNEMRLMYEVLEIISTESFSNAASQK